MTLQKSLNELKELIEQRKGGEGSGNFGHAGIPGSVGGSAPSGGGGGEGKNFASMTPFEKLSTRPGSLYEEGDPEIMKAARIGDLGDFGNYGKHYITGVHKTYLTVTKKKGERFSEPNLMGAIHKSSLKSVSDPRSQRLGDS